MRNPTVLTAMWGWTENPSCLLPSVKICFCWCWVDINLEEFSTSVCVFLWNCSWVVFAFYTSVVIFLPLDEVLQTSSSVLSLLVSYLVSRLRFARIFVWAASLWTWAVMQDLGVSYLLMHFCSLFSLWPRGLNLQLSVFCLRFGQEVLLN